jgi:hypothetical protein
MSNMSMIPRKLLVNVSFGRNDNVGKNLPSISISNDCAIVSKLSPLLTASLCSSPSLSINVTWSLNTNQLNPLVSFARLDILFPRFGGINVAM